MIENRYAAHKSSPSPDDNVLQFFHQINCTILGVFLLRECLCITFGEDQPYHLKMVSHISFSIIGVIQSPKL